MRNSHFIVNNKDQLDAVREWLSTKSGLRDNIEYRNALFYLEKGPIVIRIGSTGVVFSKPNGYKAPDSSIELQVRYSCTVLNIIPKCEAIEYNGHTYIKDEFEEALHNLRRL